ncbi:MAG TPA: type II secretion system secretin GspD [Steroidobacteraceae bacterium]|jgi:general secretion pathway protein D|nr:type II secretion system secretin GspD [Steroidobacteraceae bacterium]
MTRFIRLAALLCLTLPLAAGAQQGAQITPNYKDADLGQVIEAVSQVTGKTFIVDPRVRAQVTMLSTTPMNPAAFYEAFLAILQVHGFIAVPQGNVIKILPDATARQVPANDLPDRVSSTSDEIVTQVMQVRNISAGQLVPMLRPMMPQSAHLAAYPSTNMLIISDRASNVNRIMRIVQRIDRSGDGDIEVIRLEHASANEIVRVINSLAAAQGADAGGGAKVVADERTNSVLLSGEESARLRFRTLVAHLDTPLEAGGDTQVRYLRYADAEKLAAKLKEQTGAAVAAAGGAAAAQAAATPGGADKSVTIWAEPETNALVITAPPKTMRSLMSVVDRLDVRRAQVIIEAMLVEVSNDASRDLGVNWIVDGSGDNFLVGLFNQPIAGTSIADIARGIQDPSSVTTAPGGLTIGGGRNQDSGTNFAAILRALASNGDTNVVSMPSVITLDNEEAQIKVAQEVPFLTGQFTNTGGAGGAVNPFQTIERKEVGNILKITPQITDEDTILLKIEQEASGIAAAAAQVSSTDLVTNKRTISTRVLVDDGGMIVLGGLIEDRLTESESRVPVLGKIPVIGALFRVRNTQKTKTNLMVFIRPRVLRTAEQAAIETNSKYNYLRDLQLGRNDGKVRMIPGAKQPTLPPLVGPTQPTQLPPPPANLESFSPVNPPPKPAAPPATPAQPPPTEETPPKPPPPQESPPQ